MTSRMDQHTGPDFEKTLNHRIEMLYKNYFEDVRMYIVRNSGTSDDAKDIFQEVALVFLKQWKNEEATEILNEKAFLLRVTRNIWLLKIRGSKTTIPINETSSDDLEMVPAVAMEQPTSDLMLDLVLQKMNEIAEECRQIIYQSFFLKLPAAEIAKNTGYSDHFIKVKKHRCLQSLKKMITGTQDYQQLVNLR